MTELFRTAGGIVFTAEGPDRAEPVLFLHGFLGSSQDWDRIASRVTTRYRALVVDLPGHGQSTGLVESQYHFDRCLEELADGVLAQEHYPCHVVGYSMGARVALALAVLFPQLIDHLVLASGSPGLRSRAERLTRFESDCRLANRLEQEGLESFLAFWYSQPLFAPLMENLERREDLMKLRKGGEAQELAAALRGLSTGAQRSYWEELSSLPMPVLLVAGERDAKYTEVATEMAARIPNCRQQIVPEVGHAVHREAPERFIDLVYDFLMDKG